MDSKFAIFEGMNHPLHNPVYNALLTRDKGLAHGEGQVRFFDPEVSPFAGFADDHKNGFADLYDQLSPGRKILYAIPAPIEIPKGWELRVKIKGLQFVYEGDHCVSTCKDIVPLTTIHVDQMIALATLTKPGPFDSRTIEFGHYHGIFDNGQLVAMTGQRLHPGNYTEISAVCTHPEHTGKRYAFHLLEHQLQLILEAGQQPFLHVRDDNDRAIGLYKRMGFVVSRPMHFYFMKRD
jgi:ribosomal protein S18 acetylase RimI-like enzyme